MSTNEMNAKARALKRMKAKAEELAEQYPDRKIIAIDTLCASAGEGLIVKLVLDKKNIMKDMILHLLYLIKM